MTEKGTPVIKKRSFAPARLLAAALLAATAHVPAAYAADGPTVGFIYVGPKDDYGYNQAHHEGAEAIKSAPGVKVLEEEKVPETLDVQKTMESMIKLDGATVLFPTSFGYFDPHILAMAKKYPEVLFLHCGGMYDEAKHPKNVGSYFGYIDEGQYLNGIAAGLATKSNKLGFIAAKPIPQVLRNINAFTLGARSVNPKVTTTVIFTGDWSDARQGSRGGQQLIDSGVDVLTAHVDSPKVIVQTAEERGIYVAGYHTNQAALAPKALPDRRRVELGHGLQGLRRQDPVRRDHARQAVVAHLVRGGLKDGFVKMSPYGPDVTDGVQGQDRGRQEQDDGRARSSSSRGRIKDNKGNVVIAEGVDAGADRSEARADELPRRGRGR